MPLDYNILVSGSDIDCGSGVIIRQPPLNDIRIRHGVGIGFPTYYKFMSVMSLEDEAAKGMMPSSMPQELVDQVDVLMLNAIDPELRETFIDAFSFYTGAPVRYLEELGVFQTWDGGMIFKENFNRIRSTILTINGLSEIEDDASQAKSAKAKALYERLAKGRKELNKTKRREGGDKNMRLHNLLSALSGRGYGYNLLNVWDLTVWQFYNQFRRVQTNSSVEVAGVRWAAYGKDDFDYDIWYRNDEKD